MPRALEAVLAVTWVLIVLVAAAVVAMAARGLEPADKRYVAGGFAFHIGCALIQDWFHNSYYDVSDTYIYMDEGAQIARLVDSDPWQFGPEVVKLALHLDSSLPVYTVGEGVSTGTMSAFCGLLIFLVGPSFGAICLVVSSFASLGQILTYRVLREFHPPAERLALSVGTLLLPSVVFWSSMLAKEAFVIGFFGFLLQGTYGIYRRRLVRGSLLLVFGGFGIAVMKPYVLFPYVLAVGTFYAIDQRKPGIRLLSPLRVAGAILFTVVGLAAMGALFPEFGVDQLAETAARQQQSGTVIGEEGGGSYVAVGSGEARSLTAQLQFIPGALINSFFRPAIFEARNLTSAAAAVETTALTVGVLVLGWRFRPRRVLQEVGRTPTLAFCAVFVFTFAAAVGLATTNLGTLSRYRLPMMPFYATMLLLLARRLRVREAQDERDAPPQRIET